MRRVVFLLLSFVVTTAFSQTNKQHSAFYPPAVTAKIRANLKRDPNGKNFLAKAISDAAFWRGKTDDDLRDFVFSPGITRSWMVWSDGYCPSCKKPVRMYDWKIEAQKHPWKLTCPNCGEVFPKNDFYAYYKSGLDEKGWFSQKRVNRALLFNTEHPDAKDPLHMFGVDDGEGYVADGQRWRFIGAYEIYGQFKQLILNGINALARAYILTGDEVYAHKAGVLLNRLADFYPSFDYATQGLTYEKAGNSGYISVWHDSCEETRELALAYDEIFEGFHDERARHNIETGILHDALTHPGRVHSNFPRDEICLTVVTTVLGWPENHKQVEAMIDHFVRPATSVDGVTGEKGLSGYTAYTITSLAGFLEEYSRADKTFLPALIQRVPSLTNTWRFHIDTYCLGQFYPRSGDCSAFGQSTPHYVGAYFDKTQANPLAPSMYSFFWRLYEATHDVAYVQTLYRENDSTTKNLPHDLFTDDPSQFQKSVKRVISKNGEEIQLGSINKEAWHMAILRSGKGKDARALWLDYDSWGNHSHRDGMTMGLFAHGMDLLPDFGYPPVQFGGWTTPRAQWYTMTAAHNTVLVNQNQQPAAGKTTLWANGEMFHAVRADAPAMVGGKQYERTAALIDIDDKDFYVLDIFHTVAGSGHYKFVYGPLATLSTNNLKLKSAPPQITGGELRNFAVATNPPTGWNIDWNIQDRFHQLPKNTNLKMRYTDLSTGVDAITAEAWIAPAVHLAGDLGETWIPCLITRKTGNAPLSSTLVSVLEPFEKQSALKSVRRLTLKSRSGKALDDSNFALEVTLKSGQRDLILSSTEDSVKQTDFDITMDGQFVWLRSNDQFHRSFHAALYKTSRLSVCGMIIKNYDGSDFVELACENKRVKVIRGEISKVIVAQD